MIKVWWVIIGDIWIEKFLIEGSGVVHFLTKSSSNQKMAKGIEATIKSGEVVNWERQVKWQYKTDKIDSFHSITKLKRSKGKRHEREVEDIMKKMISNRC